MSNDRVIVRQLPESLTRKPATAFFQEIAGLLKTNRPYVVFDFSEVTEIDASGVEMLLQCVEEAMKGNGDVKFASIPPGPAAVLELTGVDHLFEIFDSTTDAVESFHAFPVAGFTGQSSEAPLGDGERMAFQ